MKRFTARVRSFNKEATTWYNLRVRLENQPEYGIRPELEELSHIELESLPSGIWGYNHFPLHARYFQSLDIPVKGQTGRFHKSWGDFGGLKNLAALEYECFNMLAHGACCSIGDQMHPRARLDPAVYERIGRVYSQVEAKEPYCQRAVPLADIGVLCASRTGARPSGAESDEGALRVLSETHQQFHFIDKGADWEPYPVIILPDDVLFDDSLTAKAQNFLENDGKILATGCSGLREDQDAFALQAFGLIYAGPAEYCPNYFTHRTVVAQGLEDMEHVLYEQGTNVEPSGEVEILADIIEPYFNRTWEHFCSHAQTPPAGPGKFPFVTRQRGVIYIANPIFRGYLRHGNRVYRDLVRNCLQLLLPNPRIRTNAPSTARLTVLEQREEGRLVVHLLHYIPERRTKHPQLSIDIIEDVIPIRNVRLEVRLPEQPVRVVLAPERTELAWTFRDGYATCVVPEVQGHLMVAFEMR